MKQTASVQKTAQATTQSVTPAQPTGSQGIALTPPAYGMAAADKQPIQRQTEAASEGSAALPQANHTGLPNQLKAGLESLSGMAMDDVRVHYHSSKPAQLQALAYTQGSQIHIAPGQEQHLPHEAWHVVQQKQRRVKPTFRLRGAAINSDGALEREAQVMGRRAAQSTTAMPTGPEQTSPGQAVAHHAGSSHPGNVFQLKLNLQVLDGKSSIEDKEGWSTVVTPASGELLVYDNIAYEMYNLKQNNEQGGKKGANQMEKLLHAEPISTNYQSYILALGEGDFFVAYNKAKNDLGNFYVATEYSSLKDVAAKYNLPGIKNIVRLANLGNAVVRFNVDATQLDPNKLEQKTDYQKLTFLNPHTDVYGAQSVESHKQLMEGFFQTANAVTGEGAIITITVTGFPFLEIQREEGKVTEVNVKGPVDLEAIAKTYGWETDKTPESIKPEDYVPNWVVKKTTGGKVEGQGGSTQVEKLTKFTFKKKPKAQLVILPDTPVQDIPKDVAKDKLPEKPALTSEGTLTLSRPNVTATVKSAQKGNPPQKAKSPTSSRPISQSGVPTTVRSSPKGKPPQKAKWQKK